MGVGIRRDLKSAKSKRFHEGAEEGWGGDVEWVDKVRLVQPYLNLENVTMVNLFSLSNELSSQL